MLRALCGRYDSQDGSLRDAPRPLWGRTSYRNHYQGGVFCWAGLEPPGFEQGTALAAVFLHKVVKMRVKLKILNGSSKGKILPVRGNEFVIGRAEGCDVRPKSDMISRRHCKLVVSESQVTIEDLGSKNGTVLNDELIDGRCGLKTGDRISVGPHEFEVVMDSKTGQPKHPQVEDVLDVAARTAEQSDDNIDVSSWLEEEDEIERKIRMSDPETRHFKIDETDTATLNGNADSNTETVVDEDLENKTTAPAKRGKKKPGKLPTQPQKNTSTSQEAAQNMLKKFFTKG